MNSQVRDALFSLCRDRASDEFVFEKDINFASLRGFRKIFFCIHLHQLLKIFDWRAKVSRSLEEPATVIDNTAAFIE
jgi:hypothetical protein